MRGGIHSLGIPRFSLKLLMFCDTLMAMESGTTAYFVPPQKAVEVPPKTAQFNDLKFISVVQTQHPGYDTDWTPKSISEDPESDES